MVAGFLELDGTVPGQELPRLDRSRAGTTAIGTRLGLIASARLLGCGLFTELPCQLPAGVVGELLDRGEVEVIGGAVGPEEILGERGEELLEPGVLGGIRR
jgi:hypothetical protein